MFTNNQSERGLRKTIMFSSTYLCICLYCMLQLGFLILAERHRRNVRVGQNKRFIYLLIITLFSFVADIMGSFRTDSALLFPFVAAGNYLEIILNTALLPIFFGYVCDQVFKPDAKLNRRLMIVLGTMAAICVASVISNTFTNQIFFYDEAKIYHRGPLFVLPMIILFAMMVIVEAFLISQKKKIEPHYYKPLALFLVSPLIGWALQLFIYGLPFSLLGITFASLVLFTSIQDRTIDQDYLTGLFNRQTLDTHMQQKINASTADKTFSAILLDIDNFKYINDRFGHIEGDKALVNAAYILRSSLDFSDFIARYGGDEFCIILDSDDPNAVENTVLQIDHHLLDFNQHEKKPYQLSFSIGYAAYHLSADNHAEAFLKIIDQKMYEQKHAKRAAPHFFAQEDL
ncbi:MAG: diguanylate cyclase [Oscillospiraceae bacterium]|nr:diguanylate cyclase [Oscillospiraceae bacterium]